MTGGDQHRNGSTWLPHPPHHKKSYNIADILDNDHRHCRPTPPLQGDQPPVAPGPSISPYPPNLIFNPLILGQLANQNAGSSNSPTPPQSSNNVGETFHHHYRIGGGHLDFDLRRSPPSSHGPPPPDFPGILPGQGSSYGLHPLAPTTGIFPSPNYISLLLANPFVQPYLHHQQRFQDFYGYNGRQFNSMGSKRKGGQVRFAAAQTARLEKEFLDHKYLHANDRKRLAQALKLTDRQVKTWFQNRRAKWRKVGVMKGHRSESHVSASFGTGHDEKEGYSPDQGRCISVSSMVSDEST